MGWSHIYFLKISRDDLAQQEKGRCFKKVWGPLRKIHSVSRGGFVRKEYEIVRKGITEKLLYYLIGQRDSLLFDPDKGSLYYLIGQRDSLIFDPDKEILYYLIGQRDSLRFDRTKRFFTI